MASATDGVAGTTALGAVMREQDSGRTHLDSEKTGRRRERLWQRGEPVLQSPGPELPTRAQRAIGSLTRVGNRRSRSSKRGGRRSSSRRSRSRRSGKPRRPSSSATRVKGFRRRGSSASTRGSSRGSRGGRNVEGPAGVAVAGDAREVSGKRVGWQAQSGPNRREVVPG